MAPWRSGYAEVCKTSYTGSIPVGASNLSSICHARVVELVYTRDLKSLALCRLAGSIPAPRTSFLESDLFGKAKRLCIIIFVSRKTNFRQLPLGGGISWNRTALTQNRTLPSRPYQTLIYQTASHQPQRLIMQVVRGSQILRLHLSFRHRLTISRPYRRYPAK